MTVLKQFFYLFYLTVGFLSAEEIHLTEQKALTGDVIKETEQHLFVDLGFDLIKVPTSHVIKRVVTTANKEQLTYQKESGSLYSQKENAQTNTIEALVSTVGKATVQIQAPTSLGSGFIISPEGYVITNNHVISGENELTVILYEQGKNELRKTNFKKVEIIAQSPLYDLALLKVIDDREFPFVPIAKNLSLEQGETVFAVGSPLGLERSISKGIVSVKGRVMNNGITLIQHTSQINPGNSGGPLFNLKGEVVGVNNLKIASSSIEGIGFAIPTSHLLHFIDSRDSYAFDPRNPNAGYRYLTPPGEQWISKQPQKSKKQ